MAYMEKLREGTLAGAIDRFIEQSRQIQRSESEGGAEPWDTPGMAPGQTLHDFLPQPTTIPTAPPPPPITEPGRAYNPWNRPPSPRDQEDPSSTPGVCGLLNMGNTCYMNAGLQCIRGIPEVAHHYLDSTSTSIVSTNSHQNHLTARFSTLLHKMWSGSFSAVHPKAFKTTLGVLHSQFADNRQQDCQEFLAMLLDTLHEDSTPSHTHLSQAPPSAGDKGKGGNCEAVEQASNQKAYEGKSHDPELANQITKDEKSSSGSSDKVSTGDDMEEGGGGGKEVESGKKEGQREGSNNRSIVTDTFQGMLRNEVLCHSCQHLSTKEEPFVYLSVPLPHAYERQIYVRWVPVCSQSGTRKTIRLLVTVLKHVSVKEFKEALTDLIGQNLSPDLIQFAEVKDNCIVKILPDTLALKHINDAASDVYGFEMAPTGGSVGQGAEGSESSSGDGVTMSGRKHGKDSDSETEGLPTKMRKSEEASVRREGAAPAINAPTIDAPAMDESTETMPEGETPVITSKTSCPTVVMEWHACSICLEEMVDGDLLTHKDCGAIVCPVCLKSSVEHYGKEGGLVPCPICSAMVKSSDGFTPLATPTTAQDIIKLLQTTILFRAVCDGSSECVAPPTLLHLPATSPGQHYYQTLSPLLPPSLASSDRWTLCLTDAKGRYCSRCLYGSGCSGCVISNGATPTELKPGDHIAVTVEKGEVCVEEMCEKMESHPSLETKRKDRLSLEECLGAFSQREELGGDNHWFCPTCEDFQLATRVLSVSRLPQTIIIHLKRFIYHGTSGSKVDAAVTFPMELDPQLVSHDCHVTQPLQLTAFVCHFGSLNCGHYTAYVRDMSSGEWAYYNDETVTLQQPSEKDAESAYILFYRRRDLPTPTLPTITGPFDDETEMQSVTQLLRQHKPPPSKPHPPPKRSNSTGDLNPPTTEAITAQANVLLASLGLDPSSAITCALPAAPTIRQSQSTAHSPPPTSQSSLLPPPPSTSIMDDYMNYDLSDESSDTSSNVRLLSVRGREW